MCIFFPLDNNGLPKIKVTLRRFDQQSYSLPPTHLPSLYTGGALFRQQRSWKKQEIEEFHASQQETSLYRKNAKQTYPNTFNLLRKRIAVSPFLASNTVHSLVPSIREANLKSFSHSEHQQWALWMCDTLTMKWNANKLSVSLTIILGSQRISS